MRIQLQISKCLLTFLSLFFSQCIHANIQIPLEIGYFNAHQGKSQLIHLQDLIGNQYSVNHANQQNFLLGLGAYFPSQIPNLDLGILINYFNSTKVSGIIALENIYQNLSYQYRIINAPIYLSIKKNFALHAPDYSWSIQSGIGPNIIYLHDYQETSLTPYSISNQIFNSSTRVQLSAYGGLGVEFNKRVQLSYRFYYLNKSTFWSQNTGVLNNLGTANAYANSFILTYFFE